MDEGGDNWSEDSSWLNASNFFTEFPEYQQSYQNGHREEQQINLSGGNLFQRSLESLNHNNGEVTSPYGPFVDDYSNNNNVQGPQFSQNKIKKEGFVSNIPQPINNNNVDMNNNSYHQQKPSYDPSTMFNDNYNSNNNLFNQGPQYNVQTNNNMINHHMNDNSNNNSNFIQHHNNPHVQNLNQQAQPMNQNRLFHPPPQIPKIESVSPPQNSTFITPQPQLTPQVQGAILTVELLQRSRQKGPGWHGIEHDEPVRITAGKGKLFKVRLTSPLPFTKESINLRLTQGKSELRIQRIGEVKKVKNTEDNSPEMIYSSDVDIKIFKGSKNIQLSAEVNDPRSLNGKLTANSVPFLAHDDGKASVAQHTAEAMQTASTTAPPPSKKRRIGAAFKGKEHIDDSDDQSSSQNINQSQQPTVTIVPPLPLTSSVSLNTHTPSTNNTMTNNNNNSSGDYYNNNNVDEYQSSSSNPNSSPLHSTSSPSTGLSPPQQNQFSTHPHNEQIAIHDGDLYVNGMLRAHGFIQYSDILLKTDIEQIVDALSIIRQFGGKKYRWKEDNPLGIANPPGGRKVIGLIAQEVQKVLPEAVELDKATGYLSVSYAMIVPVLLEALKQHLEEYEQQQSKVNKSVEGLRDNIETIREKLEDGNTLIEDEKVKELEKIAHQMEIVAEKISQRKAKRIRKEEEKERKRLEKLRRKQAKTGIGAADWREQFGVAFAVICFTCALLVACTGLALAVIVATQVKDWSKNTDGVETGSVEIYAGQMNISSSPWASDGLALGAALQPSESSSPPPSLSESRTPAPGPSNSIPPQGGGGGGQPPAVRRASNQIVELMRSGRRI